MKRKSMTLLLLAAMLLALCACAKQEQPAQTAEATPEADFPVAFCLGTRPDALDPAAYAVGEDATYLVNLYSGLVSYRPQNGGAVGVTADLCRELPTPTVDEDGRTVYTFTLRDRKSVV